MDYLKEVFGFVKGENVPRVEMVHKIDIANAVSLIVLIALIAFAYRKIAD